MHSTHCTVLHGLSKQTEGADAHVIHANLADKTAATQQQSSFSLISYA